MNSKDWYLQGVANNDMEAYKKAIIGDDLWYIDKLNALVNMARLEMEDNNLNEALKYGVLASICTESPRADVCCLLGDIYFKKDNLTWAKLWFEQAVGNVLLGSETEGLDAKYYSWYPLASLSSIEFALGNIDEAFKYNSTVLELNPENEIAIENQKFLEQQQTVKNRVNPPLDIRNVYDELPPMSGAHYNGEIIIVKDNAYVAMNNEWHKVGAKV